jgi:hypothetical protein
MLSAFFVMFMPFHLIPEAIVREIAQAIGTNRLLPNAFDQRKSRSEGDWKEPLKPKMVAIATIARRERDPITGAATEPDRWSGLGDRDPSGTGRR